MLGGMVPGGAGKAISGAIGQLGAGAGLLGGNAGGLNSSTGGGQGPTGLWEQVGASAVDYAGKTTAEATKNLAETEQKDTEALNKTNTANTQALNQTNEDVTKRGINAATIELGNYQNLVLRAGLILFGITLVAFAVWRFVAQPAMRTAGAAA